MGVVSANIIASAGTTTLFCKSHRTLINASLCFFRHPLPFQSLSLKNVHSGWFAKKRRTQFESLSREEASEIREEDADGFEEGITMDGDDYFEDELEEEDELYLAQFRGKIGRFGDLTTQTAVWIMNPGWGWRRGRRNRAFWYMVGKGALAIAEDVVSFVGDLKLYAFKTSGNSTIQIRIEKLSNKSGSPSMDDIEAFSSTYRARLDEAEHARSVPENIYLEVSSPGTERVVRIPHELDRFKDFPMYVKYVSQKTAVGSFEERDGVFKLDSVDMESSCCTWSLADIRLNRESMGKGRSLSKKQRQWRLQIPFDSLRMVRLYSDI